MSDYMRITADQAIDKLEERIRKASTFPDKNHVDLWYDAEHDVFEYTDEKNFIIASSLRELLEKVYFDL